LQVLEARSPQAESNHYALSPITSGNSHLDRVP
jgi:hypothetical protein